MGLLVLQFLTLLWRFGEGGLSAEERRQARESCWSTQRHLNLRSDHRVRGTYQCISGINSMRVPFVTALVFAMCAAPGWAKKPIILERIVSKFSGTDTEDAQGTKVQVRPYGTDAQKRKRLSKRRAGFPNPDGHIAIRRFRR